MSNYANFEHLKRTNANKTYAQNVNYKQKQISKSNELHHPLTDTPDTESMTTCCNHLCKSNKLI